MGTAHCLYWFLLLAILLQGLGLWVSAAASGPVSQAWAVRIYGPTTNNPLYASGMDVGPSGDVFLAGYVRGSGSFYVHDILITRRSSSGALVWQRGYERPEGRP